MGAKKETSFTVLFNKAKEQIPVAKANLAESDIPYEIVDQEWLAHDKSRAKVTFRTKSNADAKRLRKVIPTQPGLQCKMFVAAERPDEVRLSGREFEKKALELGYSKYSTDIVRYRIERNPEPFDWKTVSREELEANPWFANYYRAGKPSSNNRLINILLGVQQGKKCDKQPTWRNGVQSWDGERGEVKDKIYYIAEKLGIQKGYLHYVLSIDETTLRKWSYNPANVTPAVSERIFRRIAYMDLLQLRIRKISDERVKDCLAWDSKKEAFLWPPSETDYLWEVQTRYEGKAQTRDFWKVASAMLCRAENWGSREVVNYTSDGVDAIRSGKEWHGACPIFSRIANDKSLEMPVGVTRWSEALLPAKQVAR